MRFDTTTVGRSQGKLLAAKRHTHALIYTRRSMRSIRLRKVLRAVAISLLVLAGLDLTTPGLCALDQEGSGQAMNQVATLAGAPQVHIDDCFCCSHCVEIACTVPSVAPGTAVTSPQLPVGQEPFPTAFPPFHPPRP